MEGYFDKQNSHVKFIKILIGIIVSLIIANLLIVGGLISVASNKEVRIQVPQFLENGEYFIGNTQASENVYKMWSRVWINDIANFSYKDLRKKYEGLYPFLDPQTAFQSKSELAKFIKFVEGNYVSQTFDLKTIDVSKVAGGFMKITANGTIKRAIGKEKDDLSGMRYTYEFIAYVKNGQIYINSIKSSFSGLVDVREKEKLKSNEYVNFEEVIQ